MKEKNWEPNALVEGWSNFTKKVQYPILWFLTQLAKVSARYPELTIFLGVAVSFAACGIGFTTNFRIDSDPQTLWAPRNTPLLQHMEWVETTFRDSRNFRLLFHLHGEPRILHREFVRRTFLVVNALRLVDGYDAVCPSDDCDIQGITRFWNHSLTAFDNEVDSDRTLVQTISAPFYPDGEVVYLPGILGKAKRENTTSKTGLEATSIVLNIKLPSMADASSVEQLKLFEQQAVDMVRQLAWDDNFSVEVLSARSMADESARAVSEDTPLLPTVFATMIAFCSILFFRRDKAKSRSGIGIMAVISVFLSMLAGFGVMATFNVPLSTLALLLPFIFLGVGLDDAFIIVGDYNSRQDTEDILQRVEETLQSVGPSITATTLTTCTAFGLGTISEIPAISWLCSYAALTFAFILLYQVSFLVSCLVLDDRFKRRNGCWSLCSILWKNQDDDRLTIDEVDESTQLEERPLDWSWITTFMLGRFTRPFIAISFLVFSVACALSAIQIEHEFKISEAFPRGSYAQSFLAALRDYTELSRFEAGVYFRHVNQTSELVQRDMETFLNDLVEIDAVSSPPVLCWFRDFQAFVNESIVGGTYHTDDQLVGLFLNHSVYGKLYSDHIVLDEVGEIEASRCFLSLSNVDEDDSSSQIQAYLDQSSITLSQPVNLGTPEDLHKFFVYLPQFNNWAFSAISQQEIVFTSLMGVAAVSVVALLFVGHWTAVLFLTPLISILYMDLMGILRWAGFNISPITTVALVISIGLLVDYVLHILVRFYESEDGDLIHRARAAVSSIGPAVLQGATTTLLGTVPLAFSSSAQFQALFVSFLTIVLLGAIHGLVVLPVLLSYIGPPGSKVSESSCPATEHTESDETEFVYSEALGRRVEMYLPEITEHTKCDETEFVHSKALDRQVEAYPEMTI